jgi:DNA replication protein DnaC
MNERVRDGWHSARKRRNRVSDFDTEAALRIIEQKHAEMEAQGTLASQQSPKPLSQISVVTKWLKDYVSEPDFSRKPPPWTCSVCGQVFQPEWNGYMEDWEPYFGMQSGTTHCKNCEERMTREKALRDHRDAMLKKGNLPEHMRLENYQAETKEQKQALEAAYGVADLWLRGERKTRGLWFYSTKWGLGKTHLVVSLLWVAIELQMTVSMWDEPSMLNEIKERYGSNGGGQSPAHIIQEARSVDVFVLDDLGRGYFHKQSERWYQDSIIYPILDARYNSGLPTLVTSNLSPGPMINRIGGAAHDRLAGLCPLQYRLMGRSWRQREGKNAATTGREDPTRGRDMDQSVPGQHQVLDDQGL